MIQASTTPPTMQPRLKKAEATAGMKKTFFEFSMPMTSAVTDTSAMKGYMICASQVPRTLASSLSPGVRMRNKIGASATPAMATRVMNHIESEIIFRPSAQAASSPSVFIFFENVVTKAVERAPSAKRSRSMFGVRKAAVKIPVKAEPKKPFSI
jgi:hypothetical protein